jgi:6-phosphogluconolactonase
MAPGPAGAQTAPDPESAMTKTRSTITPLLPALAALLIAACGGGDEAPPPNPPPNPGSFSVGGSVSGLSGAGLVLQNNLGDALGVAADGNFSFATALQDGATYSVTVGAQPAGQSCTVDAGAGTVAGAAVTSVRVQCSATVVQRYPRQLFVTGAVNSDDEEGRLKAYGIDRETGALTLMDSKSFTDNRTTPLVHPSGRFVYAAGSEIESFRVDDTTGLLTRIGPSQAARFAPGSSAMDPLGRFMLAGQEVFTIDATTGALTRQPAPGLTDPFARGVVIDPQGRFAYSIEGFALGLATYRLDAATGAPTRITPPQPAGAAPVALVIDPLGRFVFVATSKTTGPDDSVQGFTVSADTGALTPLPAVPSGLTETRSIAIHPTGRWLVVTADTGAALFSVDTATGVVARAGAVPAGARPRPVVFDPSGTLIYIGDFDDGDVSILRFDAASGAVQPAGEQIASVGQEGLGVSAAAASVRPGPRFAYSTSANDGTLQTWRADADGALTPVGAPIVSDQNAQPGNLEVHPSQRFLLTADLYGPLDGNGDRADTQLRAYAIDPQTGALALVSSIAAGPSVTGLALNESGRFAYVVVPTGAAPDPDLGTVRVLAIDPQTGALSDSGLPPVNVGRGPFGLRIEPRGRFAYVVNYLFNDITAFVIESSGELTPAGTYFTSSEPNGIHFSPDGRFAYVFNGGDGLLVTYAIDASSGALDVVGVTPTGISAGTVAAHPTLPYLYSFDATVGRVDTYRIDTADGQPVPTGGSVTRSPGPGFVTIDPSGRFAYVTGTSSAPDRGSVYRIDPASGTLTDTGAAIEYGASDTTDIAFTIGLR